MYVYQTVGLLFSRFNNVSYGRLQKVNDLLQDMAPLNYNFLCTHIHYNLHNLQD